MMKGQQSLTNFYTSVQFQNPALAHLMSNDIRTIALYALGGDREMAYPAIQRVRNQAQGLPVVFGMIFDRTVEDLGYSFEDVMDRTETPS